MVKCPWKFMNSSRPSPLMQSCTRLAPSSPSCFQLLTQRHRNPSGLYRYVRSSCHIAIALQGRGLVSIALVTGWAAGSAVSILFLVPFSVLCGETCARRVRGFGCCWASLNRPSNVLELVHGGLQVVPLEIWCHVWPTFLLAPFMTERIEACSCLVWGLADAAEVLS